MWISNISEQTGLIPRLFCIFARLIGFVTQRLTILNAMPACIIFSDLGFCEILGNPHVTNGLSHTYDLDESSFVLRDSGVILTFLFHFSMK